MQKKMLRSKKGNAFAQLSQVAVAVAVLAIALTITFLVMATGKDQLAALECDNVTDESGLASCGYGYNATGTLQSAVDDIPGWMPLIIIGFIGSVLLGVVALIRRAT